MSHWEEMKAYVGFGPEDEARLRAALPLVEPHLGVLADRFYATIERFPGAASVFSGPAQVQRLQQTLQEWVRALLTGPWDAAYYARRLRIGQVHVRVGLPERYVFTAMNQLRRDICEHVRAGMAGAEGDCWETCQSITRVTDLELAVMSSTYLEAHEARRLQSLQDVIVQNLPVTVLVLDADGRVTSATHPSTRLFGDSAEVGRHYETFLPDELVQAADLPGAVGRALATGHEVTLPRVLMGTGARERHFRLTLVPLDHELARLLLHIEELTDVVQAEARARQTESLARIGGLAAHMAHEIRNPLAAISATLQVIVGTLPEGDRRKPILGKVQDQVHRLDRLVSDLLGYAKPPRAHLTPEPLAALAREAVARAGVSAVVQVDEGAAPSALVDRDALLQVLVNLLQNARDASGEGGRVELHVGPGATLRVLDDGPGVPPDVLDRLFEPFVTSKTRGTGLGLAICRKLLVAMGGGVALLDTSAEHPALAGAARKGAAFEVELAPVS